MAPEARADLEALLGLARSALVAALRGDPAPVPREPGARRGAFVTLRKRGALRGCVGHAHPDRPVAALVCEMAVAAAFDDPRFPAVTLEELEEITVEVSVLTAPRQLAPADPSRLEVGRHGLLLRYRGAAGLLLPQVAVEHGLDAAAFLEAVCHKAGLGADAWRHPDAEVMVFEAEVVGE